MSELRPEWSASQKQAYGFIRRAVAEGITATQAVQDYRSGGGRIANDSWYSLYRETFSFYGTREKVQAIPETYVIPETMFEPVDWDLREVYAIQVKVRGYSEELGQYITKYATVESNQLVTKGEWRTGVEQAISQTIGSIPLQNITIQEWAPVMR